MQRRSPSITPSGDADRRTPHPVPANEKTQAAPVADDQNDTRPPHSAYITQLLIDRNYTPIFHLLDNYYADQAFISREELVRRIMLVNEPPQGMDRMVSVYGDLPPEDRATAELQADICGFLVLGGMGFRTELGIADGEDAEADTFNRALVEALPVRPGTDDEESRSIARRRMHHRTSRDEPHTNEAPEAPSASSSAVDEKKEEAPTDCADE